MIRSDVYKFWAAWAFVCALWYAGLAGVYFDLGNKIGSWLDQRRALRTLRHAYAHLDQNPTYTNWQAMQILSDRHIEIEEGIIL